MGKDRKTDRKTWKTFTGLCFFLWDGRMRDNASGWDGVDEGVAGGVVVEDLDSPITGYLEPRTGEKPDRKRRGGRDREEEGRRELDEA